jgi:hypothetical protein
LYTNIEGINSKWDELIVACDTFKPDILCVTETHLSPGDPDFLPGTNFECFRADRPTRSKGGCLISANRDLNPALIQATSSANQDWEMVWCSVSTPSDEIVVGCVYRAPTNLLREGSHTNFMEAFRQALKAAANKKIIVCGDFNLPTINWLNPTFNPDGLTPGDGFLKTLDDFYLSQHVQKPTRFRGSQQPSLLDLLLTTEDVHVGGVVSKPSPG